LTGKINNSEEKTPNESLNTDGKQKEVKDSE